MIENPFHLIERESFDSITLIKEDQDELKKIINKYLEAPKHLIINLNMAEPPSKELLDYIHFLSTILKSNNYSVQVFAPQAQTAHLIDSHRFRNLPVVEDLAAYILELKAIEREFRVQSLLKSYVDEMMKHIFFKSFQIIKRGQLKIIDGGASFHNEISYYQVVELRDAFFSFVISSTEDFFSQFLSSLKEQQLAPILSEIITRLPKEVTEGIELHEFITHPLREFPTKKITITGESYNCFKSCSVMVIPLECDLGIFNLEVWIPKVFASRVLAFLNP